MIRRLLVIRFSAFGDVAMVVPTLKALALQHPEMEIMMLSKKQYAPLFEGLSNNVSFFGADLKGEHKGIKGLNKLLNEIDFEHFDAVADLHNVLRTWYLDFRFALKGKKTAKLHKGRYAKWQLTRAINKKKRQLTSAFERQQDVFKRLGIEIVLHSEHNDKQNKQGIGIAPFAAHKGKIYPLERMEHLVKQLSAKGEKIYLFGAGEKESKILQQWADKYPDTENTANRYTMREELDMIAHLRVMLTMDSANMHLASLVGTRVVSIWGATHPYAGFLGFGQDEQDCVQQDLPCRPCSVFGNKKCRFRDYRCLSDITTEQIISKLDK